MERPTAWTRVPFRGSWAVALGLLTKGELRGPRFRRLHHDVYVGALAEIDTRLRVLALTTWSRERGVVAGPLAALAYGADCPWGDAELVLRGHCPAPGADVTTRVDRLPEDEVAERFGCRLTSPVRTALDLAARAPLVEAVAAVDALAFRAQFTVDHLRALADRHAGRRGACRVAQVLARMDPRAESLPETRVRLGLLDRGVPPGTPQYPVTLANGRRKRIDLAWPRRMLALEYDGPGHRTVTGQNRDAFDRARLADLGWHVIPVTGAMILDLAAFDELAVRVLRRLAVPAR